MLSTWDELKPCMYGTASVRSRSSTSPRFFKRIGCIKAPCFKYLLTAQDAVAVGSGLGSRS